MDLTLQPKNKIMLFASKWKELKIIMLSKVSQDPKVKGHMWNLDL
jgi:hypothetical protein